MIAISLGRENKNLPFIPMGSSSSFQWHFQSDGELKTIIRGTKTIARISLLFCLQ